jgi:hypothetical protein
MSTRTRALLGSLVALGLLLAACGDDDDAASDDTTTTEADGRSDDTGDDEVDDIEDGEEDIDVCALIDLETASSLTGEAFTKAEETEDDTCQVTNQDETAVVSLSDGRLESGQSVEEFLADGRRACDPGTEIADLDLSYAEGGFACEVEGQAALLVVQEGAGALLVGHPSDPAITTPQVIGALNQLMETIVSPG